MLHDEAIDIEYLLLQMGRDGVGLVSEEAERAVALSRRRSAGDDIVESEATICRGSRRNRSRIVNGKETRIERRQNKSHLRAL